MARSNSLEHKIQVKWDGSLWPKLNRNRGQVLTVKSFLGVYDSLQWRDSRFQGACFVFLFKLEKAKRSLKDPSEVGKFLLNYISKIQYPCKRTRITVLIPIQFSNFYWSFKIQFKLSYFISHFPTSARAFQLQLELSIFSSNFPTSARTFQLQSLQFHFGLFNFSLFSNCPFQLHVFQ